MGELLGEFYRNTRESLGLTQSALAERMGCSISTISRMENGRAIRGTLAENLPKVLPVPDHTFAWNKEDALRREICHRVELSIASSDIEETDRALHQLLCLGDKGVIVDKQYFKLYKAWWLYLMTHDLNALERQTKEAINMTIETDGTIEEVRRIDENYNFGRRDRLLRIHERMMKFMDRAFTRPELLLLNSYAISRSAERDGEVTRLILTEIMIRMEKYVGGEWADLVFIVLYNLAYAHYRSRNVFEAKRLCKKLLVRWGIRYRSNLYLCSRLLEYKILLYIETEVYSYSAGKTRVEKVVTEEIEEEPDEKELTAVHHGITFTNVIYRPGGTVRRDCSGEKPISEKQAVGSELRKQKEELKCLYNQLIPEKYRKKRSFEEAMDSLDYILID